MDNWLGEYINLISGLNRGAIAEAASVMYKSDLIIFCGNGGSYACASHMAGDILMNTKFSGNTLCIGDNGVSFSAVANDYSYEDVYLRELEKRMCSYKGKVVLVLLSTSGKSPNILNIGTNAKALGNVYIVSIVGAYTMDVDKFSDIVISMDSFDAGFIEAVYGFIGHLFVRLINCY